MGILDDIIAPIKDAINDVENAFREVEKLFGEVVKFVENIIQTIKDLITELANLFSLSKIEYMFIHPFKEAALKALADIESLMQIAIKAGAPTGIGEDLEYPIKLALGNSKEAMDDLKNVTKRMILNIKTEIGDIEFGIFSDYDSVLEKLETFPDDLDSFGRAIKNMLYVKTTRAYSIVPEFDSIVKQDLISTRTNISHSGLISIDPLTTLKNQVSERLESESSKLDILSLIVLTLIGSAIAAIYVLTKQLDLVLYVLIFILVILLFAAIVHHFTNY